MRAFRQDQAVYIPIRAYARAHARSCEAALGSRHAVQTRGPDTHLGGAVLTRGPDERPERRSVTPHTITHVPVQLWASPV